MYNCITIMPMMSKPRAVRYAADNGRSYVLFLCIFVQVATWIVSRCKAQGGIKALVFRYHHEIHGHWRVIEAMSRLFRFNTFNHVQHVLGCRRFGSERSISKRSWCWSKQGTQSSKASKYGPSVRGAKEILELMEVENLRVGWTATPRHRWTEFLQCFALANLKGFISHHISRSAALGLWAL